MTPTPQQLRAAILAAHLETSSFGETPAVGTLYLPPSHYKALKLDAHLVVGGRGVGKSYWTAALQDKLLLQQLGATVEELKDLKVFVGFSNTEKIDDYPNADVFSSDAGDPYDLWRAVILRQVAKKAAQTIPKDKWSDTVAWIKNDSEAAARLMQQPRDWRGLFLFDALDRTSNEWNKMDQIVQGLLRATLWLKGFQGLYAKVFLREDQAERTVLSFPDSSKLTATRADLTWGRHDLHGLLWQRLINAPDSHGEYMRRICKSIPQGDIWQITADMKLENETQKKAFATLAGPWMGRDRRRGVPYTWSVGHLADARGLTSPRSFLAAIRHAAEETNQRHLDYEYALHFESIRQGIQKASGTRVQEVAEDYPWVLTVLTTLKGLVVPIDFETIENKWAQRFPKGATSISTAKHLPAQNIGQGWLGVCEDLQRLGLLETRRDGRIDMPDLYRVGFGLGRRGGVKPKNK